MLLPDNKGQNSRQTKEKRLMVVGELYAFHRDSRFEMNPTRRDVTVKLYVYLIKHPQNEREKYPLTAF